VCRTTKKLKMWKAPHICVNYYPVPMMAIEIIKPLPQLCVCTFREEKIINWKTKISLLIKEPKKNARMNHHLKLPVYTGIPIKYGSGVLYKDQPTTTITSMNKTIK
jgi:hypothetical protein